MPSLTPKKIDGHTYYYARYCQRVDGKPKIVRTVYLGRIEDLVATTEAGHQPPQPQQTVVAAFGDVAALWHIAGRLQVLPLLDSTRSEEHTSELHSPYDLVCRLLLEKKKEELNYGGLQV